MKIRRLIAGLAALAVLGACSSSDSTTPATDTAAPTDTAPADTAAPAADTSSTPADCADVWVEGVTVTDELTELPCLDEGELTYFAFGTYDDCDLTDETFSYHDLGWWSDDQVFHATPDAADIVVRKCYESWANG